MDRGSSQVTNALSCPLSNMLVRRRLAGYGRGMLDRSIVMGKNNPSSKFKVDCVSTSGPSEAVLLRWYARFPILDSGELRREKSGT